MVRIMCALQGRHLVLDVCLDILLIVDICLLLVVPEFFLCTWVVSVLAHLFSVGCHLLLCLSFFVSSSELLLCVYVSCCYPLFAKWWCLG